jgi:SEC-C motif-containing protein
MSQTNFCPCGSGRRFVDCCGPFVDGREWPTTPERLMRSRYTAYCLGKADWLRESWHPATRLGNIELDQGARWIGLKIVSAEGGGPEDVRGIVEFVARFKVGGRAHRLHERSRFRRREGRWYYLDGDLDPEPAAAAAPPSAH